MSAQENEKTVRELNEAYNRRDWDGAVALTAPNVVFTNVPGGVTLEGPEGVKEFLNTWATAFPDSKVETTRVVADERGATLEFVGRGTHTGVLRTPMGDIPPSGRPVDVQFCQVLELEDGKITNGRLYFDTMTLLAQVGALPEPSQ